jgi:hypothetical protein
VRQIVMSTLVGNVHEIFSLSTPDGHLCSDILFIRKCAFEPDTQSGNASSKVDQMVLPTSFILPSLCLPIAT